MKINNFNLKKITWVISTMIMLIPYYIHLKHINEIKFLLLEILFSLLIAFLIKIKFKKLYTWKIPVGLCFISAIYSSTDSAVILASLFVIPFIIMTTLFSIGFHIFFSNSN